MALPKTQIQASGTTSPQRLLTREEVAELLGVTPRLVTKLVAERRLGIVKVGGLNRFELAEVERYIDSRRRPAQP